MTWIEHPDMPGQRVEVPDLAVPHYRAAGWRVTDAPPKPQKLPTGDEPVPEEPQGTPPADSADETESKTDTESPKPRRRTTKED